MRKPFFVVAAALWLGAIPLSPGAAAQTQADNAANNADVDKRLQRLEEQMVDLSAHLGTIETLTQNGGAAAPQGAPSQALPSGGPSGGGADDGRLGEVETEVRALSAQMSDILRRLDQIERRSGSLPPAQQPASRGAEKNYADSPQPLPGDRNRAEPAEEGTGFSVGGNEPASGNFGTTIEQPPAKAQKSGGLNGYFNGASAEPAAAAGASAVTPVQTTDRSSPEARALYERAYNALVKRDYRGAAEQFGRFVEAFSSDPLAGPAYFWLGESAFVNGEYRRAADSFLKSSTNYPQNEKAAEALLKLGISLKRLGENKAACSSFAELARRFPSATPVLQRAELEKSRAQC